MVTERGSVRLVLLLSRSRWDLLGMDVGMDWEYGNRTEFLAGQAPVKDLTSAPLIKSYPEPRTQDSEDDLSETNQSNQE
jgi:hypothetical protein